jgi:hypothetical protein
MRKWLILTGVFAAPGLFAQPGGSGYAAPQSSWIGLPGTGGTVTTHSLRPDGQTGPVLGRPFSAAEVRHTNTSAFYRDSQGRMRSESQHRIVIYDPVALVNYVLDPSNKTYEKYSIGVGVGSTSIAVVDSSTWIKDSGGSAPHGPIEITHAPQSYGQPHSEPVSQPLNEDLGSQPVNGIASRGSRITITIPMGSVGNDHDIKIVNERWYSDGLQVLVKTVNNDPRFGITTYDLTNVIQGQPDAALFQVPADYRPQSNSRHF